MALQRSLDGGGVETEVAAAGKPVRAGEEPALGFEVFERGVALSAPDIRPDGDNTVTLERSVDERSAIREVERGALEIGPGEGGVRRVDALDQRGGALLQVPARRGR